MPFDLDCHIQLIKKERLSKALLQLIQSLDIAVKFGLKTLINPLRRTIAHHNYQQNDDQT